MLTTATTFKSRAGLSALGQEALDDELLRACRYGGVEDVERALATGANPGARTDQRATPMMVCCMFGMEESASLLLPRFDPGLVDREGWSALHYAAWHGRDRIAAMLLPHSDPHLKDVEGMNAIMRAACRGANACVGLLLPVSDLNAVDKQGLTADGIARKNLYRDLADWLSAQREERALSGALAAARPSLGAPRI